MSSMMAFFLIGAALIGWTLLLILSGERQRRLHEIEVKRQKALLELAKQQEKAEGIPVVG